MAKREAAGAPAQMAMQMPPPSQQPPQPLAPPTMAYPPQQPQPLAPPVAVQPQPSWPMPEAPQPAPIQYQQPVQPVYEQPQAPPQPPAYQLPPTQQPQPSYGLPQPPPLTIPQPPQFSQPPPAAAGGPLNILDMMRQDLSDVEVNNFRLLDERLEYEGEIVAIKPETSSQNNAMLSFELVVTFPEMYKGVKLYDQCVFEPKSRWKWKGLITACGLVDPTGSVFIGNSEQDLLGEIVRFTIYHSEWEGRTRNKVSGGYVAGFETPGLPGVPVLAK